MINTLERFHIHIYIYIYIYIYTRERVFIAHMPQTVSQLKMCDPSGETCKGLKCYNFIWVQRRHNCSPAASFANCVMTLYLLKMHLQTFLSIPILVTQKCQILICDTLVPNERYKCVLCVCVCVYIYIYIYIVNVIYVKVCVYIYIYIYTHTLTQSKLSAILLCIIFYFSVLNLTL